MKRKTVAIILTAALVASMPIAALGAASSSGSSSSGGGGGGSSRKNTSVGTVTVGSGLTTIVGSNVPLSASIAGDGTDNVKAVFAIGEAATAGLPEDVVAAINSINAGANLMDAVAIESLAGYSVLSETSAIVLQDATTGVVINDQALVNIYVPNLLENLANIKILCYENATNQWKVIEPVAIDFENKTISFYMVGSGTVAVVYNNN